MNPFDPGFRQVTGDASWWRCTNEYLHPPEGYNREVRDWFATNGVDWVNDDDACTRFQQLWGDEHLAIAKQYALVPENKEKVWVAGSSKPPLRPAFQGPPIELADAVDRLDQIEARIKKLEGKKK